MSRGTISQREGVLIRAEAPDGKTAFSEAVILPYFGTETLEQSVKYVKGLNSQFNQQTIQSIPDEMFATRFALESAKWLLASEVTDGISQNKLAVSYLLRPEKNAAVADLLSAQKNGYSTFKCKIGLHPFLEEKKLVQLLLSHLSIGSSLRLDANGGLNFKTAQEWLKLAEHSAIEFIEQPLEPTQRDELMKLTEVSSTRIALDETVATSNELIELSELGWKGIFVVKPSRLGNLEKFLNWRSQSPREIVYSSALETSVGTELGLKLASLDLNNSRAIGYGVGQWFIEDSLYIHPESPTLKAGLITNTQLQQIFASCSQL